MAGRPPLPAALKALQGTQRADRINAAAPEVQPLGEAGPPLEGMSEEAGKVWARLAPLLCSMRVLATADKYLLQSLCEDMVLEAQLRQELRVFGFVQSVETKSGDIMERANPRVGMLDQVAKRVQTALGLFGMTPASRERVARLEDGSKAANDMQSKYGLGDHG